MARLTLTGLQGGYPLGALAAFGLLRCCDELDGFGGARLGWDREADWSAVLETGAARDADELVAALAARQRERAERAELNWADTLKTARGNYLKAAGAARQDVAQGRREYADFLAAFTCELCIDDKGQVEPTAFYMTSGQQKFLKEARGLARALGQGRRSKGAADMFREALFGPWRYEDPQHSLGWDPATERLHALRAKSPTKEPSLGVAAAVWLAFEALPLFPCFLSERRLATSGFHAQGDGVLHLTWPLWEVPVPVDTVRSLLSLTELAEAAPPRRLLRARGIATVFRAERYRVKTQGAYYILRPAYPCL